MKALPRVFVWLLLALVASVLVSPSAPTWSAQGEATYDKPTYAYDTISWSADVSSAEGPGCWNGLVDEGPQGAVSKVTNKAATESGAPLIKAGSAGGESAGKVFPQKVSQEVLSENPSTCVYYRMETETPQVDHVIPRVRGGSATVENGQTTCPWCNASKGARDVPVNPPPGFEWAWPPAWWPPR